MTSLLTEVLGDNARFQNVLNSFQQSPGLGFADVLDARTIEEVFRQHDGLFGEEMIYSTEVVLWAFLGQVLQDGKGAACSAAVAAIATYLQQIGATAPCGDTGDYCRARAKLNRQALDDLMRLIARRAERRAEPHWLWHGHHAKLVDGFTFLMPDTPANQSVFPQARTQAPGVGYPIARACVVLSLSTAAVHGLAIGPYRGKETGETALCRRLLDCFEPGDVAVFDRYMSSYLMIAQFQQRGVGVCTRLHQRRHFDRRKARRLGKGDYLTTWTRPAKPDWMSHEAYQQIPRQMTVRLIDYHVTDATGRVEKLTIVTTLTDSKRYSKEAIADLYRYRWNAELDINSIKTHLHLEHLRCKSPEMIERELWATLLGYNLIRYRIVQAAAAHDKQPRQISFVAACQELIASWMLLATGVCRDAEALIRAASARIAAREVANRPGRIEPREVKRRPKPYRLMTKPRHSRSARPPDP